MILIAAYFVDGSWNGGALSGVGEEAVVPEDDCTGVVAAGCSDELDDGVVPGGSVEGGGGVGEVVGIVDGDGSVVGEVVGAVELDGGASVVVGAAVVVVAAAVVVVVLSGQSYLQRLSVSLLAAATPARVRAARVAAAGSSSFLFTVLSILLGLTASLP